MSYTNHTPNYELPQYIATDKPTYLVDANGAYLAIDTAMKANETAAATAQSTADANTANITVLSGQVTTIDSKATNAEQLATTAAGGVNTINSLIGNGEPTTTDKTLIGAINELNANKADASETLFNPELKTLEVTGDGVKTVSALLVELWTAFTTYVNGKSANFFGALNALTYVQNLPVTVDRSIFINKNNIAGGINFARTEIGSSALNFKTISLTQSATYSKYYTYDGTTITDHSNEVVTNGTKIKISFFEFVS